MLEMKDLLKKLNSSTGYCIDTRVLKSGEVFIALKGERDGHDYIQQALDKGAAFVLVEKRGNKSDDRVVLVDDTLKALQALAKLRLQVKQWPVIGITGSLGKTTTKYFLKQLMEVQYKVYASEKSFNNHIGVPLSILNAPEYLDYLILEFGTNHPGEIAALTRIAPPTYVLITGVDYVHMEYFSSLKAVAEEKAALLHPRAKQGLLYSNTPYIDLFKLSKIPLLTYGLEPHDYFSLSNQIGFSSLLRGGSPWLKLSHDNFKFRHLDINVLAACSMSYHLGVRTDLLQDKLSSLKLFERRCEEVMIKGICFINDSYNACETSVIKMLENLPDTQGKRIAVLGELKELGRSLWSPLTT